MKKQNKPKAAPKNSPSVSLFLFKKDFLFLEIFKIIIFVSRMEHLISYEDFCDQKDTPSGA